MSQRTEIVRFVAAVGCYSAFHSFSASKNAEETADTCLALMRLSRQFWRFGNGLDEMEKLARSLGAEVIGTQRQDRQLLLCWGKELESVRIPNGTREGEGR